LSRHDIGNAGNCIIGFNMEDKMRNIHGLIYKIIAAATICAFMGNEASHVCEARIKNVSPTKESAKNKNEKNEKKYYGKQALSYANKVVDNISVQLLSNGLDILVDEIDERIGKDNVVKIIRKYDEVFNNNLESENSKASVSDLRENIKSIIRSCLMQSRKDEEVTFIERNSSEIGKVEVSIDCDTLFDMLMQKKLIELKLEKEKFEKLSNSICNNICSDISKDIKEIDVPLKELEGKVGSLCNISLSCVGDVSKKMHKEISNYMLVIFEDIKKQLVEKKDVDQTVDEKRKAQEVSFIIGFISKIVKETFKAKFGNTSTNNAKADLDTISKDMQKIISADIQTKISDKKIFISVPKSVFEEIINGCTSDGIQAMETIKSISDWISKEISEQLCKKIDIKVHEQANAEISNIWKKCRENLKKPNKTNELGDKNKKESNNKLILEYNM
jgi:hypothetical protein